MRGTCLCDAVAFEITGPAPKLYQCHCSLCRKQGGSVSNTATMVLNENFRWLKGAESVSSYVLPTGFRSDFCSICGTTLPNPLRNMPYMWIPAGMFDGDEQLQIAVHLYVDSKACWDTAPLQGEQFGTMPEFQVLIDSLATE